MIISIMAFTILVTLIIVVGFVTITIIMIVIIIMQICKLVIRLHYINYVIDIM